MARAVLFFELHAAIERPNDSSGFEIMIGGAERTAALSDDAAALPRFGHHR